MTLGRSQVGGKIELSHTRQARDCLLQAESRVNSLQRFSDILLKIHTIGPAFSHFQHRLKIISSVNRLAAQYKAQYSEAETLALQGNNSAGLDILWELRLKPGLGMYRRAVVNLLIASVYSRDQSTFATEAINPIDIIRKEEDYNSPKLDRIES